MAGLDYSWTRLFMTLFALPPAIADKSKNGQGSYGQVHNPFIQGFGRPLAQLRSRTRTNRTLSLAREGAK